MTDKKIDTTPAPPLATQFPGDLRDYFASHTDQVGYVHIYQIAGCPSVDVPEHFDIQVKASEFYKTLPIEEKYRLYAKARYMVADAMLAERSSSP